MNTKKLPIFLNTKIFTVDRGQREKFNSSPDEFCITHIQMQSLKLHSKTVEFETHNQMP